MTNEVPYLKKVEYEYQLRILNVVTHEIKLLNLGGELLVPTFIDPEWVVRCYLLTFVVKNEGEEVKELLSMNLKGFFGDADGLQPPVDEKDDWFFLNETEAPEEVEEYWEEPVEVIDNPEEDNEIVE